MAFAVYLLAALCVTGPLWLSLGRDALATSGMDQAQGEWFFANAAFCLQHWHNPLFTTLINSPLGVNLMSNASILGIAMPLAPITLTLGASVSFVAALTLGLCGSAYAWYRLFLRFLVSSHAWALTGGALCGFAPAMITHAHAGHVNFVSWYLIPVLIWRLLLLREPGSLLRKSVWLAAVVIGQYFVGAEALLITAIGLAFFSGAYFLTTPRVTGWKDMARGLAIAGGICLCALAYPLWFQFFGPQAFHGLPHAANWGNELEALITYPHAALGARLARGPIPAFSSEANAGFGAPLLIYCALAGIWLWRNPVARAASATGVMALAMSLTGGPWRWIARLPIADSLLPTRLAFIGVPVMAILICLSLERVSRADVVLRWSAYSALTVALFPLAPMPFQTQPRTPVPPFFSQGMWRDYVHPGGTIVSAFPFNNGNPEPMRWEIATGMGFSTVEGYFVGPVGADRHGWYSPDPQPLSRTLDTARQKNTVVVMEGRARDVMIDNLRWWHADAVVLAGESAPVKETLDRLVGVNARRVGGVWVWDARTLSGRTATVRGGAHERA